jgi:hypothetical protein
MQSSEINNDLNGPELTRKYCHCVILIISQGMLPSIS